MRSPKKYVKTEKNVPELSPGALQEQRLSKSPKEVIGASRESGLLEAKPRKCFKKK